MVVERDTFDGRRAWPFPRGVGAPVSITPELLALAASYRPQPYVVTRTGQVRPLAEASMPPPDPAAGCRRSWAATRGSSQPASRARGPPRCRRIRPPGTATPRASRRGPHRLQEAPVPVLVQTRAEREAAFNALREGRTPLPPPHDPRCDDPELEAQIDAAKLADAEADAALRAATPGGGAWRSNAWRCASGSIPSRAASAARPSAWRRAPASPWSAAAWRLPSGPAPPPTSRRQRRARPTPHWSSSERR